MITIASIVSLLLKLSPLFIQLMSILIPTDEKKHEDAVAKNQAEQDKLAKEGRPTWG